MRCWIGALAGLLLISGPGAAPARATPARVLSPQSTPLLRGVIHPHDLGGTLRSGWRFGDLAVGADRAVFHLRGPAASAPTARAAMILLPPGRPGLAQSPHFSIRFEGPLPPGARRELRALVTRNDRVSPWRPVAPAGPAAVPTTAPPPRATPASAALLVWAMLLLLLLALMTLPGLLRSAPLSSGEALALCVLLGGAWWLRARWALFLPAHVNAHAYETLAELRNQTGGDAPYGNAYRLLFLMLHPQGAPTEAFVHRVNAVLGTVTVLGLYGLLHLLRLGRGVALTGALLLAVLPAHVRLSASESRFVFAGLLALWAAVQVLWYLRSGSLAAALGAALAMAVSVQVRPEMALVALALPSLALAIRPWPPRRWQWPALAAAGAFAALTLPWLWSTLSGADTAPAPSRAITLGPMLDVAAMVGFRGRPPAVVFFDPRFTPLWLPVLAGLGVVALWRARRWPVAFALGALAWSAMAAGLCFNHGGNNLRLQLAAQPFLVGLTAIGLHHLAGGLDRHSAPGLASLRDAGLALLLSGAVLWSHGGIARHPFTPQAEYLFVKRTLPGLPRFCRIFYPQSQSLAPSHPPAYLSDEAGRAHFWEEVAPGRRGSLAPPPGTDECRLWYRPTACYTVHGVAPALVVGGLQRHCHDAEARLRLAPLRVTRLRADPYHIERYGRPELEIGFFRILP